MSFEHVPVLLKESIEGLQIRPEGIYVDATLGGAGHSIEIAKRLNKGRLIAIDQDEKAILHGREILSPYEENVRVIRDNFQHLEEILAQEGILQIDGLLMDLGVSSPQLDEEDRGFTYHGHTLLDMRMDKRQKLSAKEVINTYEEGELIRILRDYGEENYAGRIARGIVAQRSLGEILYNDELVEIIKKCVPKHKQIAKHPAKKTFQAIRIEVNQELAVLEKTIDKAVGLLAPKGRIAVITFHSLEDRMVKERFRYYEKDCICPKEMPVCRCDKKRELNIVTKKPIVATEEEIAHNFRSRTAKLRIAEKVRA